MKALVPAAALMALLTLDLFMVEHGEAAMSCPQDLQCLLPCLGYLESGGSPSTECCNGLKTLKASCPTTADRRAACECLKAAASQFAGKIREDLAAALPKLCGVDVGTPISKDIQCNK
ncbi:hypothetical protein L6164_031258 [Bauhinia variegata]|uniref:Uncharacterized protein n=1 Tax=Bauhinia variegata TaxID=167791 RepID=A0ACB9LEY6_BAUVA|nr:hypothetical protein L6164_031258 [Bauhinia variegata]